VKGAPRSEGGSIFPRVAAVIPTLNCEKSIRRCLDGVLGQKYDGEVIALVIDGGSEDNTVEIARDAGAQIIVKPGMFSTGLQGARNFGLNRTEAELYWQVDSDNFVNEAHALADLAKPLVSDPSVTVSIACVVPDRSSRGISNWFALREAATIGALKRGGESRGDWWFVPQLRYGLTNCSLLRSDDLRRVGGYDSDVRVLDRLRRGRQCNGAIVPSATFVHAQASTASDFISKMSRRIAKYASMSTQEVSGYFVEPFAAQRTLEGGLLASAALAPVESVLHLAAGESVEWAWGFAYPALILGTLLESPMNVLKMRARFF